MGDYYGIICKRALKSLQCEEANSYILSMSTAPVILPLLMMVYSIRE